MLIWNPWGILGLLAVGVALVMAWVVYAGGPRRSVNRWLALILFVEAIFVAVCDDGISIFLTNASHYYGTQGVHVVAHSALPFLYLIFLGKALDTPLVRPLRHRAAVPALLAAMVAVQVFRLLNRDFFIAGLAEPWFAPLGVIPGPGLVRMLQFSGIVSAFGLAATLDAMRRTRSDLLRNRARAYAIAFAARDAYWALLVLVILPYTNPYESVVWGIVFTQSMPLATLAFVVLLGYGILKAQLFEIDLKVKLAVQKSTIVAAFTVAFLVASEVVERLLGVQGEVFGLVAAVGVGLAFHRVERAAIGLADRLMPGVQDTAEYRASRKRDVYRAALEEASGDGAITEKDRRVLGALGAHLGLSAAETRAIEREVAGKAP